MTEHTAEPQSGGRARILKSALSVFAEFGFAGASTREIARRANVTQPAIAYFFANKEEMWKAAIERAFTDLAVALDAAVLAKGSVRQQRRQFVAAFVRFAANNPEWSMFNVHEGLQTSERSQWLSRNWLKPLARRLYEGLTGETWPPGAGQDVFEAMSLVSLLAGGTLIFAEKMQVSEIAQVDAASEAFIEHHTETLLTALEALLRRGRLQSDPGRADLG